MIRFILIYIQHIFLYQFKNKIKQEKKKKKQTQKQTKAKSLYFLILQIIFFIIFINFQQENFKSPSQLIQLTMHTLSSQLHLDSTNSNLHHAHFYKSQNNFYTDTFEHSRENIIQNSNIYIKQSIGKKIHKSIKTTCTNKLCNFFINCATYQKIEEISLQTLCTECQEQFKIQSFCVYCKQIYFDNTDDGKQWIQCEQCQKWVHSECADFNTKDATTIFNCIRCKVLPLNPTNPCRRVRGSTIGKTCKKKGTEFLSLLGFDWQLTASELNSDMQDIRNYLSINIK